MFGPSKGRTSGGRKWNTYWKGIWTARVLGYELPSGFLSSYFPQIPRCSGFAAAERGSAAEDLRLIQRWFPDWVSYIFLRFNVDIQNIPTSFIFQAGDRFSRCFFFLVSMLNLGGVKLIYNSDTSHWSYIFLWHPCLWVNYNDLTRDFAQMVVSSKCRISQLFQVFPSWWYIVYSKNNSGICSYTFMNTPHSLEGYYVETDVSINSWYSCGVVLYMFVV